jgi:peptide/nickel transport system permease protein
MRKKILAIIRQPGSYRILAGTLIVSLLALATLTGSAWTTYAPDEMDLENQLTPPSISWLKNLLASEAGLKMQSRNQAGGRSGLTPQPPSLDDEDLDFLEANASDAEPNPRPEKELVTIVHHQHYLGTDRDGRDILSLLIAGARNCFLPGLVTCFFALGFGIPLGLWAGYYGGRIRRVVQVFNSTILSLPRLVLILVVICALEPNVYYTMGVLGCTLIPRVSELIATRVRILSKMGFILAAKEAALSDSKILWRHLFWYQNRAVFFIQFSLIMSESILVETTLSYLQFGTKPPEVSWGNIIEGSQMSFFSGFYWITFFPALAIILAILGFFYLGDGLNARLAYREGR